MAPLIWEVAPVVRALEIEAASRLERAMCASDTISTRSAVADAQYHGFLVNSCLSSTNKTRFLGCDRSGRPNLAPLVVAEHRTTSFRAIAGCAGPDHVDLVSQAHWPMPSRQAADVPLAVRSPEPVD